MLKAKLQGTRVKVEVEVKVHHVKSIFYVFHIFTSPQLVLDGLPLAAFNRAKVEAAELVEMVKWVFNFEH